MADDDAQEDSFNGIVLRRGQRDEFTALFLLQSVRYPHVQGVPDSSSFGVSSNRFIGRVGAQGFLKGRSRSGSLSGELLNTGNHEFSIESSGGDSGNDPVFRDEGHRRNLFCAEGLQDLALPSSDRDLELEPGDGLLHLFLVAIYGDCEEPHSLGLEVGGDSIKFGQLPNAGASPRRPGHKHPGFALQRLSVHRCSVDPARLKGIGDRSIDPVVMQTRLVRQCVEGEQTEEFPSVSEHHLKLPLSRRRGNNGVA